MRLFRRLPSHRFPALVVAFLIGGWFGGLGRAGPGEDGERNRTVLLVPTTTERDWRDLAFLCAVPAAAARGEGFTPLLTVDPVAPWRPELLDFLRRYEPDSLIYLGGEMPSVGLEDVEVEEIVFISPDEAACQLAWRFWKKVSRGVVFEETDRSAPLAASALAARLGVPLFPASEGVLSDPARQVAQALGIRKLIYVVEDRRSTLRSVKGFSTSRIAGAEGVVRFLERERLPIEYLAACNPLDSTIGPARKLSLAAVLFAAGREGAVATFAYDTKWKVPFPASEDPETKTRSGSIDLADCATAFTIAHGGRHWTTRIDLDGDGVLGDEGEGPFRTGDAVELAGRRWTVDLDVTEGDRGTKLWLSTPDRETVRADLGRYLEAAGGSVTHLCLVGWPQVLPSVIVSDAQGIDTDLVSDLPLANTDDDPFVELCSGRVIAEDVHAAVLHANRSLLYEELLDESWSSSFATAEWGAHCSHALESVGFQYVGHHDGEAVIGEDSPLSRASVIAHGSHAMWTVMGKTYAWDTAVLLAPCFVESSGCSTASLDQDPEYRSVAARMLRNGAVAFIGNTRRGVAQQEYYLTEVRNALLGGKTLGEANRLALNSLTVAVLDGGEQESGLHRYQLYNQTVFGDPALRLHLPRSPIVEPARAEQRGKKVTVHAPSTWWRYHEPTLGEWKSGFEGLHYMRGAGLVTDSWWHGGELRNDEASWLTVEAQVGRKLVVVEAVGEVPAPLGWTGKFFLDAHADGTRSVWWRCRLIDFDMRTGEVGAEVESLSFRLK